MSKILLVGPITNIKAGESNWAAPPLGIHRIAAYLNANGHYAEVYDCNIQGDLEHQFRRNWDVIGFSTLQATLHNDIKAMWKAKELCPRALLVAGGIESTLNFQDVFDLSPVQLVILAEGEKQLLGLANGMKPEDLDGVIIKHNARPITDEEFCDFWNNVDFSQLGFEKYWEQMRAKHPEDYDAEGGDTVRLVTSSHCLRGCSFCSVTQWHKFACGCTVKSAMLSAIEVWKIVKKVKSQLPTTKSIYFVDDDFIQDRQRVMDFFGLIHVSGPAMRFQVQTHTSHILTEDGKVDMELLEYMMMNGVEHITLGVENACYHCLKSFNKPQRLDMVPLIIKTCKYLRIRPYILIILFPATSTLECLTTNYRTLTEWINMGATISIEPNLRAYRGAPLYNSPHEMLYETFDIDNHQRLRYPIRILPDDLEAREIQRKFNARWSKFLDSKDPTHSFKGITGKFMVELLGVLLAEREEKN